MLVVTTPDRGELPSPPGFEDTGQRRPDDQPADAGGSAGTTAGTTAGTRGQRLQGEVLPGEDPRPGHGEQVGTATPLFVRRSQPDATAAFRSTLLARLLVGAGSAAALALLVTAFVTRHLTRPLRRLTADVERLRHGPTRPVSNDRPKAPGEIGLLRDAVDQMTDQLRRQERLRRALIGDVGHQLRTPATILLGELEAIRDGVLAADDEQIGCLDEEVQRIARLVEDVASLADAAAAGFALEPQPLDLAAVTAAAVHRFDVPMQDSGVTLVTALDPVLVAGDRGRLEQLVGNLVSNAVRFAPRGGEVELAVFAEVAAAHGGSVVAANRPDGGACMTVRVPRLPVRVPAVRSGG